MRFLAALFLCVLRPRRSWTELTNYLARLGADIRLQSVPSGARANAHLVLGPEHGALIRRSRDSAKKRFFVTSHGDDPPSPYHLWRVYPPAKITREGHRSRRRSGRRGAFAPPAAPCPRSHRRARQRRARCGRSPGSSTPCASIAAAAPRHAQASVLATSLRQSSGAARFTKAPARQARGGGHAAAGAGGRAVRRAQHCACVSP